MKYFYFYYFKFEMELLTDSINVNKRQNIANNRDGFRSGNLVDEKDKS